MDRWVFLSCGCMTFLCTVSLRPSAYGDQRCHFWEKEGEIKILLQTESAEKQFLHTYINAYLKNQYLFDCLWNLGFFHHFSLLPDSRLFRFYIVWTAVPPYITTPSCLAQMVVRPDWNKQLSRGKLKRWKNPKFSIRLNRYWFFSMSIYICGYKLFFCWPLLQQYFDFSLLLLKVAPLIPIRRLDWLCIRTSYNHTSKILKCPFNKVAIFYINKIPYKDIRGRNQICILLFIWRIGWREIIWKMLQKIFASVTICPF